jgi:hypothetical protein
MTGLGSRSGSFTSTSAGSAPSPTSSTNGCSPRTIYALAEHQRAGFEPDILTLRAVVEVVSKGNKSGRRGFEDFLRKAAELLSHEVHLLILDLQPPTGRDPQGIHGAIWDEVAGQPYTWPEAKSLSHKRYYATLR